MSWIAFRTAYQERFPLRRTALAFLSELSSGADVAKGPEAVGKSNCRGTVD